jgi:hypothetical protein
MDPTPVPYAIRIHGHLGATVLSAFPALVSRRHGADTVLTENQVTGAHRDGR